MRDTPRLGRAGEYTGGVDKRGHVVGLTPRAASADTSMQALRGFPTQSDNAFPRSPDVTSSTQPAAFSRARTAESSNHNLVTGVGEQVLDLFQREFEL